LSSFSCDEKRDIYVVCNNLRKGKVFFHKISELSIPSVSVIEVPFRYLGRSAFRNIAVLIFNLYACFKIISFIIKEKIDIVYSNTSVNTVGIISSILMGKKHIWHFHEPIAPVYDWADKGSKFFYKLFLKYKKNTTVFISDKQRKEWQTHLNLSLQNSKIICNPLKEIEKNEKPQLFSQTLVFGFMGTLAVQKNIALLIDSFFRLVQCFPEKNIKLLIVGEGSQRENIEQQIKKINLQKQIELMDYCLNVEPFYSCIDVLILPSLSESWGLVALEALSVEKTLIMTTNTGLHEVLENNVDCIFIDPLSETDLYKAMEKVLLDTQYRQQLAKNGYEKVKKLDFNNQFVEAFREIFNA
jgi:glycosyltransferase involved in cell wall biosynthesis